MNIKKIVKYRLLTNMQLKSSSKTDERESVIYRHNGGAYGYDYQILKTLKSLGEIFCSTHIWSLLNDFHSIMKSVWVQGM